MGELVYNFCTQLTFLYLYAINQYGDLRALLLHHLIPLLTVTHHAQLDAADQKFMVKFFTLVISIKLFSVPHGLIKSKYLYSCVNTTGSYTTRFNSSVETNFRVTC